jgi:ABC-type antimicrobial peptide transport system permease subunit
VLRDCLGLTLLGAAGGVVAAAALSRVIEGLLFGVSPTDAASYAATVAIVGAVAVVTAWLPAARAARIDPVRSLRSE